jgi:protein-S-isoprenylcysteine O-methyltransferase Ste14
VPVRFGPLAFVTARFIRAAHRACLPVHVSRSLRERRAVSREAEDRERRGTAGVIAPPPVIFLLFLGLGLALEALMPENDLPAWLQWIGAALIAAGVALVFWFESALKRVNTSTNPYRPTTALSTSGPYRFTRNPAYVGMVIVYVGIALAADAPWALVMLAPAVVVIQLFVIVREERYLERLFGEEYLSYKRRVRRWI